MEPLVKLKTNNNVTFMTLNRPASFNALNLETARELSRHLLAVSLDDEVRAVVITGEGKAFSAGGDIKGAQAYPGGPAAAFHALATHVHLCIVEIRRMGKPVIAAINGIAAGGGFALALACDFRVMSRTATMRQAFTSNGLCIDAAGTFTLPRLVGFAKALEIAAFDPTITADQALHWGLVTRVVGDESVQSEARSMAENLAARSVHSFSWSKALMTDSFDTALEAHLEKERQGLTACAAHADGQEGMRAFMEKRPPVFGAGGAG